MIVWTLCDGRIMAGRVYRYTAKTAYVRCVDGVTRQVSTERLRPATEADLNAAFSSPVFTAAFV